LRAAAYTGSSEKRPALAAGAAAVPGLVARGRVAAGFLLRLLPEELDFMSLELRIKVNARIVAASRATTLLQNGKNASFKLMN
jgi:hypothetical protein